MAKGTKTKAATVCVPQTRDEATAQIAAIGKLQRELEEITTKMNLKLAATKEAAELRAAPAKAEIEDLTEGLRVYCDANREALTKGKVKFFDFGTGVVRWRQTKPAVRGVPRDADKLAALIAAIREKA
ncbi:MAG: host-nuclease inhibitor Gam family protein [Rhodoblastus sp.]|nr:MAG: host-nuclease inhibitor Gam family protein [Rhodoblastus sp.]